MQIDNSFGGFVLDNGPGAVTIGFRGLGAGRTLVMLNGRRLPPAGIGGAPVAADLSLIPSAMIERVENLFDGASTVYGSDAIAGVANVITRTDVQGFRMEASVTGPEARGGDERVLSAMWGNSFDRGSIRVGFEHYERLVQSIGDNPFADGCEGFRYETPDGQVLRGYRGIGPSRRGVVDCDANTLTNRVFLPRPAFWGSIYYTPGYSNTGPAPGVTGIPNFSDTGVSLDFVGFFPHWVLGDSNGDGVNDVAFPDGDGDGLRDVDWQDSFYNYDISDYAQKRDFYGGVKVDSILAEAEYGFLDANDTTVYGEIIYSLRRNDSFSPGSQLFEWVPASNPYNPCGNHGIDCVGGALNAPPFNIGPIRALPIINIRGDRDRATEKIYQWRVLGGIRGNIGALANFGEGNWIYDAYLGESYSRGLESRVGISEPRLQHSLATTRINADGSISCPDDPADTDYNGCVPVNLFAPNIYQDGGGTLTPEEAQYLFVRRKTETEVKQRLFNAYVAGDLFALPWNDAVVPLVLGVEYRVDEIISNPNEVASEGLLWGWFSDKGADGTRSLREVFTEAEFPLLRGVNFAEEFTVTAGGRWTKESFYDAASVYSVKTIWRPNEWLTLRGTHGTSYRAPDLRARFLNGTTGFVTRTDPCVVPNDARDQDPTDPNALPTYNAAEDQRDPHVLDSCRANGVDPTTLGLNPVFTGSTSVEAISGGSELLVEEESVSTTYGVVIEQPIWEDFDLTLSLTHYDIEVTNAVAQPSTTYILSQCYDNLDFPMGGSAFCSRIMRNATTDRLEMIDTKFLNFGKETAVGWDINLLYQQDFELGDELLEVTLDLNAVYLDEQVISILDTSDDNAGEPALPNWRANARLAFDYRDWRFTWFTRFIGAGENDDPGAFEDDGIPCDGLPVSCRPVYYTEDYQIHTASVSWNDGKYFLQFGVENVFNTAPPEVDGAGVFSRANVPLGIGYELLGRTAYLNFSVEFAGFND